MGFGRDLLGRFRSRRRSAIWAASSRSSQSSTWTLMRSIAYNWAKKRMPPMHPFTTYNIFDLIGRIADPSKAAADVSISASARANSTATLAGKLADAEDD